MNLCQKSEDPPDISHSSWIGTVRCRLRPAVLWIRIRIKLKFRIRIRIKMIWHAGSGSAFRISINLQMTSQKVGYTYLRTFSRFWAFIWKLGAGSGSGSASKWQAGSATLRAVSPNLCWLADSEHLLFTQKKEADQNMTQSPRRQMALILGA